MDIAVTNGITVAVETQFLPMHSNAKEDRFIFAYHILIENGSPYNVQLMGRHWYIHDGPGRIREVQGDGVIGQQPIIPTGERFEYNSYCDLGTEIGKMRGYYLMKRLEDDVIFQVEIPEFRLIEPSLFN